MKVEHGITIADASLKHGVKRSTLTSWVKKEKVVSEKRMVGNSPVHFIDENSLLAQMATSTATFEKPERSQEQPPKTESNPSPPANSELELKLQTQPPLKPETGDSGIRKKTNSRKRSQSNIAVSRAKNSMRSLDLEDLVRVNFWLANRISEKSFARTTSS